MLKCPVCSGQLTEIQKFNVFIDVCQNCKGVWLDRGELEKILEIVRQEKNAMETERQEYPKKYREEHVDYHEKYKDHYKHKSPMDYPEYDDEYYYKKVKHKYPKSKKEKISKVIETIFNIFD
ncbi:MAG: zf-TFIIB domain-containing protein [Candidatus Calescibacterium sp.]|nr:zf-TFIIB domain-containing protein [Candidatus Calescibacterium sp.]MDW8132455.1 zf-TFIIB domain-containing protein [Candidatus Calescibacterium sp.]